MVTSLSDFTSALIRFRDERNWKQFHTPKDLAISVSVEAAELLEIFQWRSQDEPLDADTKKDVGSEIADILIYTLLLCDNLGIDPMQEAERKLKLNAQRFPAASTWSVAKPKDETKS